jgi:hypothetical protein
MATKFDAVAASELRDTQGEILDVKGADISELLAGRGIVNDNHSNKLPDVVGRIIGAKKIFGLEDCENDRHKYYWNKIKAPYIYTEGLLYDDEDHRSAKAAAAIIKHQFKTDSPLKLKCSVEGGILERGQKDQRVLKRTKIRGLALTLTPANNATLVEGLDLVKSAATIEELELIKSYAPYAIQDVPSFMDFSQKVSIAKIRHNVEQIHEIVESLKKNISLAEPLEKASKKQLLQQLGSDPQAAEIADWLSKDVKRDDVQQWFLRGYKKDPKIWNTQNKEAVQHYVGTAGTNPDHDIGKVRFDKSHSFEDGMRLWKDAEDSLKNKKKDATNLLKPDSSTKKLIDLGNGWGWYDLGKGYDEAEGKAMAHCGNVNAQGAEEDEDHHHDRILSLRKEHKINGETYHEPRLSFIENNGYLGETKGFGNSKPAAKYHDAIIELLKHPRVKENVGGGYAPNNNFYINDLPKDKLDKLLKDKPNLENLWKLTSGEVDTEEYPQKHHDEAELHNQALWDLDNGEENIHQVRFRDIDPEYAKGLISKRIRQDDDPDDDGGEVLSIMQSPHLDKSHIDQAFNENPRALQRLLYSHAANKEHVDRALSHDDTNVRVAAIDSPHFGPQHMDKAFNDNDPHVRRAAARSSHFGPQHFDKAFNDEDLFIRLAAIKSPHFGPQHMDQALGDKEIFVRQTTIDSPHFGPQHFDKAFNDNDPNVRHAAIKSPHFGPQHMERALNDKNGYVRLAAAESSHFGPQHFDKAFNDNDQFVRAAAVKSSHFGPQHMDQALGDNDPNVRHAAVISPHFGPQHMDKALNDKEISVRETAVQSPHFGPQHVDKALSDNDPNVRVAAVRSPHFGLQHMERALSDSIEFVRGVAMQSPHYQTYLKQKDLNKALTAGYGGAGSPTNLTGGGVLQAETLDQGRSFRYIDCPNCGKDQVYMKHQVKCRSCGKSFPFDTLANFFLSK